ncbi:zinc ABC transporter substrate-binding protein [Mobilitalea sibirica]|uniref:Zinc ABC transporter substrate-binding protein n=1 Tax=Mobilitalea sibirica TaxID=1462919 RepID=A0A8J7HAU8_9FIRM|nr:metal ABC transporter substrate-binding protein [Mobilitalea sibirica]MBH1940331.1 zinc ABC transporter substrate-binding protein [Mobilitalea sibirica]
MKKKLFMLISIMAILLVGTILFIMINQNNNNEREKAKIQVATSFYPTYIMTLNLVDQIDEIEVRSLTDFSAGCLHDYQLTTEDMKILSEADVLIMNGGGMETYIEDVINNYPDLGLINSSKGIPMLSGEEEEHDEEGEEEEEEEEHEHGPNPHVWLDPQLYITQIINARNGLVSYIQERASIDETISDEILNELVQKIESNAREYIRKVTDLDSEYVENLKRVQENASQSPKNNKVVIFHDSFEYIAARAGLEVAYTVEVEEDTALSAGEIAEVIDLIRQEGIPYLFTEEQYGTDITQQIEKETDADVYVIDSGVTGDGTKDSYLNAMQNNLNTLQEAFR